MSKGFNLCVRGSSRLPGVRSSTQIISNIFYDEREEEIVSRGKLRKKSVECEVHDLPFLCRTEPPSK